MENIETAREEEAEAKRRSKLISRLEFFKNNQSPIFLKTFENVIFVGKIFSISEDRTYFIILDDRSDGLKNMVFVDELNYVNLYHVKKQREDFSE